MPAAQAPHAINATHATTNPALKSLSTNQRLLCRQPPQLTPQLTPPRAQAVLLNMPAFTHATQRHIQPTNHPTDQRKPATPPAHPSPVERLLEVRHIQPHVHARRVVRVREQLKIRVASKQLL